MHNNQAASATSSQRPRGRLKRWRKIVAGLSLAFLIAFAPTSADALQCSVRYTNYGSGWFAAYLCHGIDLISPDGASCVYIDGNYYIARVYCPEIATVNVS